MKVSEKWLRAWVDPALSVHVLAERLTMAGLEVEGITPVAGEFSSVVVARVTAVNSHPNAERLQVCEVDAGDAVPFTVVCGARNVFAGMKAAFAREGAVLLDGTKIKKAKLRGVASAGMLCSARELGLAEESEGLIVLPEDAPVGMSVRAYLQLDDHVLDVAVTPDRGDCLSVAGLAHEIAALADCSRQVPIVSPVMPADETAMSVRIADPALCPHYAGRIIRHIDPAAVTPLWLSERLRRSGLRCIHPVVDIMNYVCLEWGQPLHAFDLAALSGDIAVRRARVGEEITLLDGQMVQLHPETLVIADERGAQAIAGVMGGADSAVQAGTQDIFLESAFFTPECVARAVQAYHLSSDASYRFERGVDPFLQVKALERATQLVLEIAGGVPGPIVEVTGMAGLPPAEKTLSLDFAVLQQTTGISIPLDTAKVILQRLGFQVTENADSFTVKVPARRFDIICDRDLVHEILRIYGYDKIEPVLPLKNSDIHPISDPYSSLAQTLCESGYHEVITYSFVDKKIQTLLDPQHIPLSLVNPVSAEMNVMRTSLLPGLINVLLYNLNRQQERVRIFETGACFLQELEGVREQARLGLLVAGSVFPLQWGMPERAADFFDLKGEIENLLQLTGRLDTFHFRKSVSTILHPGQSADIYRGAQYMGTFGMLHPRMLQMLDLSCAVGVAELMLAGPAQDALMPAFTPVSAFPAIRRDIAILVDVSILAERIQDTIKKAAGSVLQSVTVFDIWQGEGVPAGRKSMAFALILQDVSRTLTDEEVAGVMQAVITALQGEFQAELRG